MSRESVNFEHVEERKNNNQPLHPSFISKAIATEVKVKGNFKNGEILFGYLTNVLNERKGTCHNYQFNQMEVVSFQRAVGTMVRYAPTAEKARYMFNLTLKEFGPPLRTSALELTLLNNLVYVHTQFKQMKEALGLIEVALEIGIFQFKVQDDDFIHNHKFSNPQEVFETLSNKVLRYFRLEFNQDKTELRPITKQFSR